MIAEWIEVPAHRIMYYQHANARIFDYIAENGRAAPRAEVTPRLRKTDGTVLKMSVIVPERNGNELTALKGI